MAESVATDKQWRAVHRFARISPRKAMLVMDLIRGRHVDDAKDILRFTSKKASRMIDKVLHSAIANASEQEAVVKALWVTEARADPGPYFKRWRPKDRGRAHPIAKRSSHLIVTVEERES